MKCYSWKFLRTRYANCTANVVLETKTKQPEVVILKETETSFSGFVWRGWFGLQRALGWGKWPSGHWRLPISSSRDNYVEGRCCLSEFPALNNQVKLHARWHVSARTALLWFPLPHKNDLWCVLSWDISVEILHEAQEGRCVSKFKSQVPRSGEKAGSIMIGQFQVRRVRKTERKLPSNHFVLLVVQTSYVLCTTCGEKIDTLYYL